MANSETTQAVPRRRITLGKVLSTLFGVFTLFAAFATAMEGGSAASLFMLLAALFVLPFTRGYFERIAKVEFSRPMIFVGYWVMFWIGAKIWELTP